jgi:hypothetical protein
MVNLLLFYIMVYVPQAVVKLTKDVSTGEDNVLRSVATKEPVKTASHGMLNPAVLFTIPVDQAWARDEILSSIDTFIMRSNDAGNYTITTMYKVAKAVLSEGVYLACICYSNQVCLSEYAPALQVEVLRSELQPKCDMHA